MNKQEKVMWYLVGAVSMYLAMVIAGLLFEHWGIMP
jgi:hypothetical protein